MGSDITNVTQVFNDRSEQDPKGPDTQFELVCIILY